MHLSLFHIHTAKYEQIEGKCNLTQVPSILQYEIHYIYLPEHLEHPPNPSTSDFFTALIVLFNPPHPKEL